MDRCTIKVGERVCNIYTQEYGTINAVGANGFDVKYDASNIFCWYEFKDKDFFKLVLKEPRNNKQDWAHGETPAADEARGGGMKFDAGKPQARLLFAGMPRALAAVIGTLDAGAKKGYPAHSWKTVPNGADRYQDASYRHDIARNRGELIDPETGCLHRAHHIVNELFLLEMELEAGEKNEGQ